MHFIAAKFPESELALSPEAQKIYPNQFKSTKAISIYNVALRTF